jgi:MFS family permease
VTNGETGWLRALRRPMYRRVWTVFGLQQFGYWFSSIGFQWLVARETDNDAFTLSLLYFSILLPMLLISLPAGVLADTHDRRRIVLTAQYGILTVGAVTTTLVLLDRAPVVALMVCGFAVGVVHSVAQPASQALVANAVPVRDLPSAVVLQSIAMNLARISGPAIAGVLILAWGAVEALIAYGLIALISMFVLRGVRVSQATPATREDRPRLLAGIAAGLRHARARPPAALALAIVAVTSFFAISYMAQLPAVAALVSDDPRTFLVLTVTGGAGSLLGVLGVAVRPLSRPSVTPAAILLLVLGACVVGLGVSRVLWVQFVLIGLCGGVQFAMMTLCNTVLQQVVDDSHRGRVMSLYTVCWGGLLPVGGLVLGTLWHFFGPTVALCAHGAVVLAFALWVLRPGAVRSQVAVPREAAALGAA